MMTLGNIRVYEKALAALGGRPEAEIARQLLQENRKTLAFEQAIDRIIAGEARQGLRELRALGLHGTSAIWKLAFASWRVFPKLARPMLTLRRAAHARGGKGRGALFFLGKKAA